MTEVKEKCRMQSYKQLSVGMTLVNMHRFTLDSNSLDVVFKFELSFMALNSPRPNKRAITKVSKKI